MSAGHYEARETMQSLSVGHVQPTDAPAVNADRSSMPGIIAEVWEAGIGMGRGHNQRSIVRREKLTEGNANAIRDNQLQKL